MNRQGAIDWLNSEVDDEEPVFIIRANSVWAISAFSCILTAAIDKRLNAEKYYSMYRIFQRFLAYRRDKGLD